MRVRMLIPTIAVVLLAAWARGSGSFVRITAPQDGSQVPHRPVVEGAVSDAAAKVWVVVHPLEVTEYYVQPRPSVRRDGSWRVQVYVGRLGGVDVGKQFEILAIANPSVELREGHVLPDWPKADVLSDLIVVTRK